MTYSIHIPTVTERLQDASLLEAWVQKLSPRTVKEASRKKIKPVIFPLLYFGDQHKQGVIALEKVNQLFSTPGFRRHLPEKIELHCPILKGTIGGDSVQLGLAITLLLSAFQVTTQTVIIASGCFSRDEVTDDSIHPVAKLQEKMASLLNEKDKWVGKDVIFFVPTHYLDTLDDDATGNKNYVTRPIEDLQQHIDQLYLEAGIKVIPISRLSDVLDKLNLTYRQLVMPTKTQMVIAASLLLMLVGVVSWILKPSPIPVITPSAVADKNSETDKKIAKLVADLTELKDNLKDMHSLDELRNLAELGDDKAQYQLSLKYLKGEKKLSIKNPTLAAHWLEKAAKNGNVRAMVVLGALYYQGAGVDKNLTKAKDLFSKAAPHSPDAHHALALIEQNGGNNSIPYWEGRSLTKSKTGAK